MAQRPAVVAAALGSGAALWVVAAAGSASGPAAPARLVGVTFTGFDAALTLQSVTPRTLRPEGPKLRLGRQGGSGARQWARRGRMLAIEVTTAALRPRPITIVDTTTMHAQRSIPVGKRDVCGLTFDGSTLVALTAVPWCFTGGNPAAPSRFFLLRIDAARGRVERVVRVEGLEPIRYSVNVTFGGGRAFVARQGGGVDAIDLRTGSVRSHRPRRALSKLADAVYARWLGGNLLGVGARIVDVATWHARQLTADAQHVTAGGPYLVAYGDDGAFVFTRTGRLRFRLFPGEAMRDAHVIGRYLYVDADADTEVIDLRTHRRIAVVPHADPWTLLAN